MIGTGTPVIFRELTITAQATCLMDFVMNPSEFLKFVVVHRNIPF
jgi:hypothetical protein